MATYLTLVNLALARQNEVLLTSDTFDTAVGPQQVTKDAVNAAIADISRREQQWPFNYSGQSFNTTGGVQEYTPPANVKVIKWNTFGITRDDNANPAIIAATLVEMDYNTWAQSIRPLDQQMDTTQWTVPSCVIKGDDGNIIISRPPNVVTGGNACYVITYDAWADPTPMTAYSDTCPIPDIYNYIIADGIMYYGYDFRSDTGSRQEAKNKFDIGIAEMQRQLIKPTDSFKNTMIVNTRTFNSIPSRYGL